MKLTAQNPLIAKLCQMPAVIDHNDNFKGHQLGITIAIKNNQTNETENMLSTTLPDRDDILQTILEHDGQLIQKHITTFDRKTNSLIPKTIYMIPYIPEHHSSTIPTQTDCTIEGCMNAHYDVKIELLFLEDEGFRRYITMKASTRNIGMMDLVRNLLEDCDSDDLKDAFQDDDPTFLQYGTDSQEENGYLITYYDNSGEPITVAYSDGEHAMERLVSVRMLECKCVIEK